MSQSAPAPTNIATDSRLMVFKAVLWFLVGTATTAGIVRLALGLGPTSALSDAVPWGLWKGFNVLACIPMAAGGFVIAGAVHCFHLRKYHPIVRPTVLIAFLGYMTAVTGLVLDIGKPWNIWRPIFYWNVHSPLFEVAWCIMLYATVMLAEFAPVLGERFAWAGFVRLMKRLTPVLAILAVAISTLHQSTLGTLFTLSPERLHPLWFSPVLNILFLASAIGMGLGFLTLQFLLTSWLYRREAPWDIIRGLVRAAAWVLGIYLVLRLGDLAARGQLALIFSPSHWTAVFWTELLLSTVAPILLFTLPATRGQRWSITWGCAMAVTGVMLQRLGVGAFSQYPVVGFTYVPTLSEIAITSGVVAMLGLIFLFAVEHLRVWEEMPKGPDHFTPPAVDPVVSLRVGSPWLGGYQRGTLAWLAGLVIGLVIMEIQVPLRSKPLPSPVDPARNVTVTRLERSDGPGQQLRLVNVETPANGLAGGQAAGVAVVRVAANPAGKPAVFETSAGTETVPHGGDDGRLEAGLLIDGGTAGRFVLFAHKRHEERLGDAQSCRICHHQNLPLEIGTSCARCHRDMYQEVDIFSHAQHAAAYGEARSCAICHADPGNPKTRAGSKACGDCHESAPPGGERNPAFQAAGLGRAPGYQAAMHGLCIPCHQASDKEHGFDRPHFGLCSNCHADGHDEDTERLLRAGWSFTAAMVKP